MIPVAELQPEVARPLPECEMPTPDEVTEEGFGWFRNTWFMGRVPIAEAIEVVREEGEIIAWLDRTARDPGEFECLATAIENSEADDLSASLRARAGAGLSAFLRGPDDFAPLGALEIGVAGLAHVLSAIGCLTAASCRSHASERSWSDCPVVFFAAPGWRLAILADLVVEAGCGLDGDRGMFTIYGRSIRNMHCLAELIVRERRRFRRRPDTTGARPRSTRCRASRSDQLMLLPEGDEEPR